MNLRQLHQFIVLAEVGNFHRAAEQLHVAQPALSVSIRRLEEELGVALFERGGSGTRLTAAGQAMLEDARRSVFHAAQCRQRALAAQHGQGGLLRVAFIGSATYDLLPRLIPSLRQRYPRIELELSEATSSEVLEGVTANRFDVGFLRYPVLDALDCEITPVDRDEFVLAVPSDSALGRRKGRIALSAVADQPFIMYPRGKVPGLSAMAMLRCQASGFVPRVAQEAMQVQTIMSLVASGLGVALIAGISQRHTPAGVRCLRLSDNPPDFHISIGLACARDRPSQLVERFTAHVLETYGSLPKVQARPVSPAARPLPG